MRRLHVLVSAAFLASIGAFLSVPASAQDAVPPVQKQPDKGITRKPRSTTYTITVLSNGKPATTITLQVNPATYHLEIHSHTSAIGYGAGKTADIYRGNVRIDYFEGERLVTSITGDEARIVVTHDDPPAPNPGNRKQTRSIPPDVAANRSAQPPQQTSATNPSSDHSPAA